MSEQAEGLDKMHQYLSKTFSELFHESKQLTGHLEVIKGYSGDVLEQERHEWVELAVSTIEELHENVQKLIAIIESCHDYRDSQILQADILAVLGDFAYHASIFGFYYFIIDDVMKLKSPHHRSFDKENEENVYLSDKRRHLNFLVLNWKSELSYEQKMHYFKNFIGQCHRAAFYLHRLFEEGMASHTEMRYYLFKRLHRSVLSLQYTWSVLLNDYEKYV